MSFDRDLFLPVSRDDMARRGWDHYDVLIITGDAYVDLSLIHIYSAPGALPLP